ncbi:MAG: TerB family tellurite resistance protein [Ectothiorhodospiraceae bacterium]|nr:TerB family tellurite resistance protein [Chromatiales bacterium]MCP5156753.1 TerB family tellurite resistance protein [Ectothiorhodospiraceae bacterium]
MIERLKRILDAQLARVTTATADHERERGHRLAAAALLLETARADYDVDPSELAAAERAVRAAFGLDDAEAAELVELAEDRAREAVSLYEFTSAVNAALEADQKSQLIQLMWEVAFSDGALDKHEEHLVRRVADLLHVPHREFIRTKHVAEERMRGHSR